MEENKELVIQQLDESVLAVIGSGTLQGFKKAHVVADAIVKLKALLTTDYMSPIMALQGSRLGFRTDKDLNKDKTKGPGYPVTIVRDCLIEAVLIGLQPTGNQFNIIASNMYITKEGCGEILNKYPGLSWSVVCGLPKVTTTSAAVDAEITWRLPNMVEPNTKTIPIAIKIDQWTSVDAIIGKATRKGRAWLIGAITGVEIPEGDVTDITNVKAIDMGLDPDSLQMAFEEKRSLLAPEDEISIERILKNKEVASYKKVKTMLDSVGG